MHHHIQPFYNCLVGYAMIIYQFQRLLNVQITGCVWKNADGSDYVSFKTLPQYHLKGMRKTQEKLGFRLPVP